MGERVVRAGVATVVGAATCWSVWRAGAPQPSTLLPYTVLERAAEWRARSEITLYKHCESLLGVMLLPMHLASCVLDSAGWSPPQSGVGNSPFTAVPEPRTPRTRVRDLEQELQHLRGELVSMRQDTMHGGSAMFSQSMFLQTPMPVRHGQHTAAAAFE